MNQLHALLILLASFLRPGFHPASPPEPELKVVTQIQVEQHHQGIIQSRTYQESGDMEAILTYLRLLERQDPVQIDPDTFRADVWDFRLGFSDGSSTGYRQLHRDFLQRQGGKWRRILCRDDLLFPPP